MAQTYAVTGITTGVYHRLELRDLQKNYPIQWSLFIQAADKVHQMDAQKPNGWMQIGAIHGLPYTQWTGDPKGPQNPVSKKWEGYCYHASALFPPWHRVLLLLLEQAIVEEAIAIADGLNNAEWKAEARKLRFPYWDWTRGETAEEGIPQVCQETMIPIVTPDGKTISVPNPLNHYKYASPPGETDNASYMAKWARTFRWVKLEQRDDPKDEQYAKAQEAFAKGGEIKVGDEVEKLQPLHWLRAKVAALFTYDLTVKNPGYGGNMWGYFSNTGATADKISPVMPTMPPSLEEPHNQVHLHCGGDGSMSLNEYAGFDPIFFLHHCNVDRLYAFWEYLYPEYWVANGWVDTSTGKTNPFITDDGTFYQEPGTDVDNVTPCHPFRNKQSVYWTSEDARGLLSTNVNKYYTYPPIKDPRTGEEVNVQTAYDHSNVALRERYRRILYNDFSPDYQDVIQHHQRFSVLSPLHSAIHSNLLMRQVNGATQLRQFYLVGELPEFAYPGSYRLELYLANHDQVHVVNSISVLARADPDRCAACVSRRAAGNTVRGHMPLDPRLITYLVGQLHLTRLAAITQLNHLATLVHGSFAARLVRPDGTQLAAADQNTPGHLDTLHASKTPKLTLHSHVLEFNHQDPTAPIKFHSQEEHGVFGANLPWKAL